MIGGWHFEVIATRETKGSWKQGESPDQHDEMQVVVERMLEALERKLKEQWPDAEVIRRWKSW